MNIAITGGGGFLGRRLALALLKEKGVARIKLVDASTIVPFSKDQRIHLLQANLLNEGAVGNVAEGADVIFHLAAVVSGQAESDFDLGMRVNLDATRLLLEAARSAQRRPKFIFTSSLAVFGPPLPEVVTEDSPVHPGSSYGAEKAIGELLVSDYSRRGFIDGRVLRLPTVCVRPGKPNAAASSFVSGIIREPLAGVPANCPVDRELKLWLSSPKTAVANLVHAGIMSGDAIVNNVVVNLPGITVTVAEMIDSLGANRGPGGHQEDNLQ